MGISTWVWENIDVRQFNCEMKIGEMKGSEKNRVKKIQQKLTNINIIDHSC